MPKPYERVILRCGYCGQQHEAFGTSCQAKAIETGYTLGVKGWRCPTCTGYYMRSGQQRRFFPPEDMNTK